MTNQQQGKLTILIAADTYPPDINGSAHFSSRLAQGLARRNHEVHVLAPSDKKGKGYSVIEGKVNLHRLPSHSVPTHATYRVCLPWEIKREVSNLFDKIKPDVVHVQCHYLVGRIVVKEAVKRNIRLIATNHFVPECLSPFLPFPGWLRQMIVTFSWRDIGRVFSQAAVVTTPTSLAIKPLQELSLLEKVISVSNGIDVSLYELMPDESIKLPEYPVVLFVGRLDPDKSIDVLIQAIAQIPAKFNVHLTIIGDGKIRKTLENMALKLGIAERVSFLGHVDERTLRHAYLSATLFCMPGTVELQSIATLEAMAASKPVVLANAMALPLLIEEGQNGYLFAPGDSSDLAQKILTIIQLPENDKKNMGEASYNLAKKHHLEATLIAFENLYKPNLAPSS